MSKPGFLALALGLCLATFLYSASAVAQEVSPIVMLRETGFPSSDSPAIPQTRLEKALTGARFVSADQLAPALTDSATRLLVLPYGSAFPEETWPIIHEFLQHGGNLLVLGGRPFTRAAYHDASGWHLRDYSTRFSRSLQIDQYQSTPGSAGAVFTPNPDIPMDLPQFSWKQAFSPIIRLSTNDLYNRGGSAGSLDISLDALVWGVTDGRRLSAPLLQIDNYSSGFDGGRWIFLSAELASDFYSSPDSLKLLRTLAGRALQGALQFTVRPVLPLYRLGEPIELETIFHSATKPSAPLTAQVSSYPADSQQKPGGKPTATISLPASSTALLSAPAEKGLYIIEARLL